MQIFIKSLTKSLIINANSTDTIKTIKYKIKQKEGIPVEIQTLVYCTILENIKTLSDYNIKDESNIVLYLPLKSSNQTIETVLKSYDNKLQLNINQMKSRKNL